MASDPRHTLGIRIFFLQAVLVGGLIFMGAKSFDIQILKAQILSKKAKDGYEKHLTIKGARGQILDRHMNELGTSVDALTVSADPSRIKDPKTTAGKLAKILGLKSGELTKKFSSDKRYALVAHDVFPDQAAQIRALHLAGIYFKNDFKRFYPNRDLAAQVLGFTGNDDAGLEGLEFKYNGILDGDQVQIQVRRDGNGRILDIDKKHRDELRGNSIILTLDKKIQFVSERALEQAVRENKANSGMAVVMRPDTGEVLAIAHYPRFNPNNYTDFNREAFRNRAVTDAFEPGSAMKVFTAAAALEKGFTPKSIFFCENGKYRIGKFVVHDTHEHEWLSINQIIKVSSNIGAAKISETIGKQALHEIFSRFGFGSKTRVGCPGETTGTLLAPHLWSNIDAGAISFGQGMSVSAIQLASGISAIANKGHMMKPMLVKRIVSNAGKDIRVFSPTGLGQVVSSKTAAQVSYMMNLVVQADGTGTKAALDGYTVCGKTGTAQKVVKGQKGYAKDKYTSVFAGFAPKNNPRLAVVVVVDEPRKKYYGGDVAAPAFKTILAKSFNYLSIPPDAPRAMVASAAGGEGQ